MKQAVMFNRGEETPIFSGTPPRVQESAFIAEVIEGTQETMFKCPACRDTGLVALNNDSVLRMCLCAAGEELNREQDQDYAERHTVIVAIDSGVCDPVWVPPGLTLKVYDLDVRMCETHDDVDSRSEYEDDLNEIDGGETPEASEREEH